jgi:START domain
MASLPQIWIAWYTSMLKLKSAIILVFYTLICTTPYLASGQSDWKLSKTDGNIQIWIKNVDGPGLKQFKLQTTFNRDLKSVYRLIRDVENMHLWYDKVQSVKLLKKINENEAVYLLGYDLPFPFEDRISTVKGKIQYDEKQGKILVNTDYFPADLPADKKKIPLITKIKSSWEISETKNGEILILHTGYMDPGGNVPTWVVNESLTSGPLKTIKSMKNILEKY